MGEVSTSIWENLGAHLILSQMELREYKAMKDGLRRTEWIFGRAAAKDAVRSWVKRHHGLDLFPADVEIVAGENGQPTATGPWTQQIAAVPRVSIAHKGAYAVAAAGRGLLGVDLEHVASRDAGFESVAFDDHERKLLQKLESTKRDEWVTRAWCAKEAAGKAAGVGLADGPATMVVRDLDQGAGALRVSCGTTPSARAGVNGGQFVVHSIRDGDYIVAIAVQERNGHAG
jgi:phosphopantetheinyl transferase